MMRFILGLFIAEIMLYFVTFVLFNEPHHEKKTFCFTYADRDKPMEMCSLISIFVAGFLVCTPLVSIKNM